MAEVSEVALLASVQKHVRHHDRFYAAALLGCLVWAGMDMLRPALRVVVAGDCFFAVYLVSTAVLCLRATPDDMRRRATYADEGVLLITLLTLSAVSLSLWAIFTLFGEAKQLDREAFALSIASVPLGWLTLHTVTAFRYAHLYYTQVESGEGEPADAGGLAFPGTHEPTLWDFLYYSFVIGMTSQVSDVQVLTEPLRRMTLTHGVTSFFFNTVLLALAVNIGATYAA